VNTIAPLFLYLKGTAISEDVLAKMVAAGYLPIEVESFESVQVVQPVVTCVNDPIAQAALKAVLGSGSPGAISFFGKFVAEALTQKGGIL